MQLRKQKKIRKGALGSSKVKGRWAVAKVQMLHTILKQKRKN